MSHVVKMGPFQGHQAKGQRRGTLRFQEPARPIILSKSKKPGTEEVTDVEDESGG